MPPENRDALLAEYEKIGMQEGITINLRFVVLGAFIAANGFLATAYGYVLINTDAFSRLLLAILALAFFWINVVFLLMERRTSNGMQQLRDHGFSVGVALDMPSNIYAKILAARPALITHEVILAALYSFTAIAGLLLGFVIAYYWQPTP